MNKMDLLKTMFAAFPNSKPTEATYGVYLEVLQEIPVVALAALVKQSVSQPTDFPPSAGSLLDLWRRANGNLPPIGGAARGWLSVLESLKTKPASPLADPIAKEAVRALGGISVLRASENPGMDRAHFFRIYEELAAARAAEARDTTEFKALSSGRLLEGD